MRVRLNGYVPEQLTTGPNNGNTVTARGRGTVERSLQRYGARRSIVVDKYGMAIAGNATLGIARKFGIPVPVIESDGSTLYAVQRTDLDLSTDVAAMELGVADNRRSEVDQKTSPRSTHCRNRTTPRSIQPSKATKARWMNQCA